MGKVSPLSSCFTNVVAAFVNGLNTVHDSAGVPKHRTGPLPLRCWANSFAMFDAGESDRLIRAPPTLSVSSASPQRGRRRRSCAAASCLGRKAGLAVMAAIALHRTTSALVEENMAKTFKN
jgi:hypothetical protein